MHRGGKRCGVALVCPLAKLKANNLAADDQLEITYDPNKLDQYINDMNHRLEPLDLKLTLTIDEVVGEKLWAMVRNSLTTLCIFLN